MPSQCATEFPSPILDGTHVRAGSARVAWQDKRIVANRVISSSEAITVVASPIQLAIVPGCHACQSRVPDIAGMMCASTCK